LCKKYSAAYGGERKFRTNAFFLLILRSKISKKKAFVLNITFRAAFSTILRSKIVENAALKKYYLAASAAK